MGNAWDRCRSTEDGPRWRGQRAAGQEEGATESGVPRGTATGEWRSSSSFPLQIGRSRPCGCTDRPPRCIGWCSTWNATRWAWKEGATGVPRGGARLRCSVLSCLVVPRGFHVEQRAADAPSSSVPRGCWSKGWMAGGCRSLRRIPGGRGSTWNRRLSGLGCGPVAWGAKGMMRCGLPVGPCLETGGSDGGPGCDPRGAETVCAGAATARDGEQRLRAWVFHVEQQPGGDRMEAGR